MTNPEPRFIPLEGCRSYATYENAEKAARKASDLCGDGRRLTFVIIAGQGKEAGRFTPSDASFFRGTRFTRCS